MDNDTLALLNQWRLALGGIADEMQRLIDADSTPGPAPKPAPIPKNSLNRVTENVTLRDGQILEGKFLDGKLIHVPSSNASVRFCEIVNTPLAQAAVYVGDKNSHSPCPGVEIHNLFIHRSFGWGIRIGAPNARGTKVHDIHFDDWQVNNLPKGMSEADGRALGFGPNANMREMLQCGTGLAGSKWDLECEVWNILVTGRPIDLETVSVKANKVFIRDVDISRNVDGKKRGFIMNRHGGNNRYQNIRGPLRVLDGPIDVNGADELVIVYGDVQATTPEKGYPQPHDITWANVKELTFDETSRSKKPINCREVTRDMVGGPHEIDPAAVGVAPWLGV